jgi:hypothetical protein
MLGHRLRVHRLIVAGTSKPIVKVRIGRALIDCMSATIVDESMPPDRNAPSGTSAIIWPSSDWRSSRSSASTASAPEPWNGEARPRWAAAYALQ